MIGDKIYTEAADFKLAVASLSMVGERDHITEAFLKRNVEN